MKDSNFDLTWHGSKNDISWYELYKDRPVRVKIKNISRIGNHPHGTFIVRSFSKINDADAEFSISSKSEELFASVNLDNPPTYLDRNYDRKTVFLFYSGDMPISARQAFNLFQTRKLICSLDKI